MQILTAALLFTLAAPALADAPKVINASATRDSMGWKIAVTLGHDDTGWDHYADGWEVTDEAGNRLALRELMHPHVHEQPFTRSPSNVVLPDGTRVVFIRARCSIDGWSGTPYRLDLQN